MKQDQPESFKRIKLLGEGAFGKAYLVQSQVDQTFMVIKEMDMRFMSEEEKQEAIKESRILARLKHPNIINFRQVFKTKKAKLCIVMDYADGGDIYQKIKSWGPDYIPEQRVLDWFTQLCLAVKHVHDRKIIHRDIKSQNVFLTRDDRVKLGDFGIARVLRNTRDKAKTIVGTPYYLAPELIENKPYSFHGDMWSLGVLLYEMCAKKQPFDADNLPMLALKIVSCTYSPLPTFYSKELRSLVSQLLTVKETSRPTVHQVLSKYLINQLIKLLEMPIITTRIKNFLSETLRQHEFSHTVLHNQNILANADYSVEFYDPNQPLAPTNDQHIKLRQNGIPAPLPVPVAVIPVAGTMFPEIKREQATPKNKALPRVNTPTNARKQIQSRKLSGEDRIKLPEIKSLAQPIKVNENKPIQDIKSILTSPLQEPKNVASQFASVQEIKAVVVDRIDSKPPPPVSRQASRQINVPSDIKLKQHVGRLNIQTPETHIKNRVRLSEIASKPSQQRIKLDAALIRCYTKDSAEEVVEGVGDEKQNEICRSSPQKQQNFQNFFIDDKRKQAVPRGQSARPKLVKSPSLMDALMKQGQRIPEKLLRQGGRCVISDGERDRQEVPAPETKKNVRIVLGQANFDKLMKRKEYGDHSLISFDHGVKNTNSTISYDHGVKREEEQETQEITKNGLPGYFDQTLTKIMERSQDRHSNSPLSITMNEGDTDVILLKSSYINVQSVGNPDMQSMESPLDNNTFTLTQSQVVQRQTNFLGGSEATIKISKFTESNTSKVVDDHLSFDEKIHHKKRKILVKDPFSRIEEQRKTSTLTKNDERRDSDDDMKQMVEELQGIITYQEEQNLSSQRQIGIIPTVEEQNSLESFEITEDNDSEEESTLVPHQDVTLNDENNPFLQTMQYLENKKPIRHLQDQLQSKLKQFYSEIYQIAQQYSHSEDLGQKKIMQRISELIPKNESSTEGVATLMCALVVMQRGEGFRQGG